MLLICFGGAGASSALPPPPPPSPSPPPPAPQFSKSCKILRAQLFSSTHDSAQTEAETSPSPFERAIRNCGPVEATNCPRLGCRRIQIFRKLGELRRTWNRCDHWSNHGKGCRIMILHTTQHICVRMIDYADAAGAASPAHARM
jgi:hypothetical protein